MSATVVEVMLWSMLLIATITDLVKGKIYNSLTFPMIIIGILFSAYLYGVDGLSRSFFAVLFMFAICFPFYWLKAFAAGDVKLIMAVAAWTSIDFALSVGMWAIIFGAVVGLIVLLNKSGFSKGARSVLDHLRQKQQDVRNSTRMPFGPAFLAAFLFLKISKLMGWSWV